MKKYIDYLDFNLITFEGSSIPKDPSNRHYQQFLEELKNGEAELVPYVPPAPTWEEIRAKRNQLLQESDWVGLRDVTLSNEQAWLNYRQALRDIPSTFTSPETVVWPQKPI